MGRPVSCPKEAPIYFGGKSEGLWFINNQYNRARDDFDWNVMNALIALNIGENRCPTEAQWAEFCIVSAVVMAVTGDSLIMVPKSVSLNDVEKCSWNKFWNTFGDYNIPSEKPKTLNLGFIESLLRIFIPRNHYVDGPGRPYVESYFVTRWKCAIFPDCFNDKTCNVRLCHLQRGKEIFNTFPIEIKKSIGLISNFIPLILKEVNIAIKQ